MLRSVLFCLIVAIVNAEWVIDTSTQAGILVGVGIEGKQAAIAASSSDSEGARPQFYDGSKWTTNRNLGAGLLLDGKSAKSGALSAFSSLFSMYVSQDHGDTWSAAPGFGGPAQCVRTFGDSNLAAVGGFATKQGPVQGVAVSTDGNGADWKLINIPDASSCRYGAFPSEDTWYITAGMWNTSTEAKISVKHVENYHLNHAVKLGKGHVKDTPDTNTGWWGQIYKTTDAGSTWSTVFKSGPNDMYYFNAIDCSSDGMSCVAVAEGQGTLAFTTTDGGENWTKTYEGSTDISLMAVSFASDKEVWIAPAQQVGRQLATNFMYSADAGQTWTSKQTLDNCFALEVDFSKTDGSGATACLNSAGTAGAVAMYL